MALVLTNDGRAELDSWARRRTSAASLAMRSGILGRRGGGPNAKIGVRLGLGLDGWMVRGFGPPFLGLR
jgi:hypothetical protein